LSAVNSIFGVLNIVLVAIASISLLVGGIGIMNIMFVTVSDKTKEIGVRRAIGARKKDILVQFIIESTILSIFGGFLGLFLAFIGTLIVRKFFPAYIDIQSVILALVISSSGSWMAKGIKTKKPTIHVSYIHHPPRFLYGYETAIEWKKYLPVRIYAYIVNHFLRIWDFYSSKRPDYIIANSKETQSRIKRFYQRDSVVIYPPVNIPQKLQVTTYKLNNYYITVSRLAKAKHIDILIEAAN